MREIVVIAQDMRSTHNIGSLFRTADAMGIKKLYLTGYTAYPKLNQDTRLPHIADKLDKQINKTALGATSTVEWEHVEHTSEVIKRLHKDGFEVVALEQASNSITLNRYKPGPKAAILLGTELTGINKETIRLVDKIIEIPMFGKKESLNVVQAAAIAMYECRFYS